MDVAALTAFLAPALGFLLRVGDDVADRARVSLGDATWAQATRLWARLRGEVESDAHAMHAAERLAQAPDDAEARAALTFMLRRILDENPELRSVLDDDWKQERDGVAAIAAAERSVAIAHGDENVVFTGDVTVRDSDELGSLTERPGRRRRDRDR